MVGNIAYVPFNVKPQGEGVVFFTRRTVPEFPCFAVLFSSTN